MRRFMLAAALAALGAAVLASPAFAFDHHFTVLDKQTFFKQVSQHKFRFKDRLLDPDNRHNKVGRDRFTCRSKHHKLKCHGLVHLNGKIGGFGDIRVRGDVEAGDHHLVVLGGSGQFDGVAGKVTFSASPKPGISRKLHFDLVR